MTEPEAKGNKTAEILSAPDIKVEPVVTVVPTSPEKSEESESRPCDPLPAEDATDPSSDGPGVADKGADKLEVKSRIETIEKQLDELRKLWSESENGSGDAKSDTEAAEDAKDDKDDIESEKPAKGEEWEKPGDGPTVRIVPADEWRDHRPMKSSALNCNNPNFGSIPCTNHGTAIWIGVGNRRHTRKQDANTTRRDAEAQPDGKSATCKEDETNKIPLRLSFSSHLILDTLEKVTGETLPCMASYVRPFRLLLENEDKIRESYAALVAFVDANELEPSPKEGSSIAVADSIAETTGRNADAQHSEPSIPPEDAGPKLAGSETDGENALVAMFKKYEPKDQAFAKDQWASLIHFMDHDLKDITEVRRSIKDRTITHIEFEHLEHLYKPGDLIVSHEGWSFSKPRAYRALHVTGARRVLDTVNKVDEELETKAYTEDSEARGGDSIDRSQSRMTPLIIDCFYFDYDGYTWSPQPRTFVIREYTGARRLAALGVLPVELWENSALRDELVKRGKQFVDLATPSHKQYYGRTLSERGLASNQAEVNGKVMVDQRTGYAEKKHTDRYSYRYSRENIKGVIVVPTKADKREVFHWFDCGAYKCTDCTEVANDAQYELDRRAAFIEMTDLLDNVDAYDLRPEHLELLPLRIYGYALQERKWHALSIDQVEDIPARSGNAFDNLVLQPAHKKLIQALVKNQTRRVAPKIREGQSSHASVAKLNSMDIVPGKGRGLIILLHGVPGVGKTSTAECVAAELGRPLFPITCGDLGTGAHNVEERLEGFFHLAQKWNCVMLLDEADVFLQKRATGGDVERNALVSVFLRALEYYAGVLILTTNRVLEFDEAFRSRIHISLYYPPLDKKSSLEIWDMNLRKLEAMEMDFNATEIRQFADQLWDSKEFETKEGRRWNGRQIKNAFQTAIAMANWDYHDSKSPHNLLRPKLKAAHFEDVSEISAHFDDYLFDLSQRDDHYSFEAKKEGFRTDSAPLMGPLGWAAQDDIITTSSSKRTQREDNSPRLGADNESENDEDDDDDDDDFDLVKMQQLMKALNKTSKKKKGSSKSSKK